MSDQKLGFAENFALSGVAAVVSKTAAAPIERIKLLVQNQDEMIRQGRLDKPYNGVIDCTMRTIKTEGVYPLWRGNLANCLRYFPTQALDFARTRLANDAKGKGGERQYKGLIDVHAKTLKSDGIQGLYRGFVISCVGIFVYRGMYFGLYDSLKPILLGPDAGLFLSFCLGYGVTVTSGLMSYPIDTIRRRMMMTSGTVVKYKGSIDCAVQIMKNEGFMSMMKGAGANILRGVAGAGVLAGFDSFKKLYIGWRKGA